MTGRCMVAADSMKLPARRPGHPFPSLRPLVLVPTPCPTLRRAKERSQDPFPYRASTAIDAWILLTNDCEEVGAVLAAVPESRHRSQDYRGLGDVRICFRFNEFKCD